MHRAPRLDTSRCRTGPDAMLRAELPVARCRNAGCAGRAAGDRAWPAPDAVAVADERRGDLRRGRPRAGDGRGVALADRRLPSNRSSVAAAEKPPSNDDRAAPMPLEPLEQSTIEPVVPTIDVPVARTDRADRAAPPSGCLDDPERWKALAEEIRMQVLQRIDIFTDTGLREQLTARLQPSSTARARISSRRSTAKSASCCAPTSPRRSSAKSSTGAMANG